MLKSIKEINYKGKIAFICDNLKEEEIASLCKNNVELDVYVKNGLSTNIIENAKSNLNSNNIDTINFELEKSFSPFQYNAVVVANENTFENIKATCKSLATPVFSL